MKIATDLRETAQGWAATCPHCGAEIVVTCGAQLYCGACAQYARNPQAVPGGPGDPRRPGRCRDCGAYGPRDARGLGWNCGCAAE